MKILQYLQKNTCVRVSFLSKSEFNTGFPVNIAKILRRVFYRIPPVAAFGSLQSILDVCRDAGNSSKLTQ